jgi:hypothetical protein
MSTTHMFVAIYSNDTPIHESMQKREQEYKVEDKGVKKSSLATSYNININFLA